MGTPLSATVEPWASSPPKLTDAKAALRTVRGFADTDLVFEPLVPRPVPELDKLAEAVDYGEVFTRQWIVDLILDLAGYTADRDLATLRAVEPACGSGAFLGPMTARLSSSLRSHGRSLDDAADAIRAYDLLEHNVAKSRDVVAAALRAGGWAGDLSSQLAGKFVQRNDYLLQDREDESTDFVLGNPPYIRLEDVPDKRLAAYRAACPTMGGRADTYIGFIEVGLRSLRPGGTLGYIVADRWMHNAYGARLRQLIGRDYSVEITIKMHDVNAFEKKVSAYPAVSILRRAPQGPSVVADTTSAFGHKDAEAIVRWRSEPAAEPIATPQLQLDRLPHWFPGDSLWPSGPPAVIHLMEDLADNFEPVEDSRKRTRVGIGVATGADGIYVTKDAEAVESERLLPLSMAWDTNSGELNWSGHYLVNPWSDDGLVDMEEWPRFQAYMTSHGAGLQRRNVALRNPRTWHRTIDRVMPGIAAKPKLLFPDMRMTSRPVYDPGGLYPHHNLYYVISDVWDLKVLGGLLFSRVAEATINAYCVKMRGGTMRFQAQYLRKLRLPAPDSIEAAVATALREAFERRDAAAATDAALAAYGWENSSRVHAALGLGTAVGSAR